MFTDQTLRKSLIIALSLLIFTAPFIISARLFAQAQSAFVIWVYDKNVRDSQFGYYDGVQSKAVGALYPDLDIEGLACIGTQPYASSGGDGRVPSQLFTLQLDLAQNKSTLTLIGGIRQADGRPFYEVSSLTHRDNQIFYGFAADPGLNSAGRGLLQLDATTGIAELILPSTLDIADIIWQNGTLWLAAGNQIYTWVPGSAIQPAFKVVGINQIEALELINGILYVGGDDVTTIFAVNPQTGVRLPQADFAVPNDIEGMTRCPAPTQATPTPTATATLTATDVATATAQPTNTPVATATPTPTETESSGQTSATLTATPTPPATSTPDATPSPTSTPSPSSTPSPTASPTMTPSATETATPTLTPIHDGPGGTTNEDVSDEPARLAPKLYLALIRT